MSRACCDGAEGQAPRAYAAAPGLADRLALAASPTFAVMAVLSVVVGGDPAAMICSAGQLSPLSGMATMYLLMSAFHAAPWLKRIGGRSLRERAASVRRTA